MGSLPSTLQTEEEQNRVLSRAVPLRFTVRCTVIRYGTEIRRTTVFIRFWTIYTVKYGTAYGTVQTLKASVKKLKLSFVSALQMAK